MPVLNKPKALVLLSGGLDSTLALKVMLNQGVHLEAVNFFTPFCRCSRKSGCGGYEAKRVADRLGVRLRVFTLTNEYLEIVQDPKFGYGKNLNPCIDCRILMHKKAKEYMQEIGASFIVTGEVLGQRPMSQHKAALNIIERESGLKGLVLRPLSAKLLPETIPEKEGWVKRQRLLGISGRSRKPQMAKARELEIGDYPCPAGGCLLTDPGFAQRMRDLLKYAQLNLNEIALLKLGRHFRLLPSFKAIIGRNKEENERLRTLIKQGDICLRAQGVKGPVGLGRGKFDRPTLILAAQIVARYSDSLCQEKVKVLVEDWAGRRIDSLTVERVSESKLRLLRI